MRSFGEMQLFVVVASLSTALCQQDKIPILDSSTTIKYGESNSADKEREGIEKEILGPLRIWHVVFIVGSILLVGLTVLCCCVEVRIPRTRLEIEENYEKRRMNEKYLHQLERTPDVILRQKVSPTHEKTSPSTKHGDQDMQFACRPVSKGSTSQNQHQEREVFSAARRAVQAEMGRSAEHKQARMANLVRQQMYGIQTPLMLSATGLLQGGRHKQQHD